MKTHGLGELGYGLRQHPLERRRRRHIDYLSALHTMKVVVMLGEILGKLEASEIVVGSYAPDKAKGLQVRQVTVGRAGWKIGKTVCDIADAHRMAGIDEEVDDRPAP